jgi:hypothetical protein
VPTALQKRRHRIRKFNLDGIAGIAGTDEKYPNEVRHTALRNAPFLIGYVSSVPARVPSVNWFCQLVSRPVCQLVSTGFRLYCQPKDGSALWIDRDLSVIPGQAFEKATPVAVVQETTVLPYNSISPSGPYSGRQPEVRFHPAPNGPRTLVLKPFQPCVISVES